MLPSHDVVYLHAGVVNSVATYYELPIRTQTSVLRVTHVGDDFRVDTADQTLRAKHVIWAAGEFQYPHLGEFHGSELCRHTAAVDSYERLSGDDVIIVGGYESGIDAAYHLALHQKRSRLFDAGCPWKAQSSDPSVALSTYSLERMRDERFLEHVTLFANTTVTSVALIGTGYEVMTSTGHCLQSTVSPLLAVGFDGSHKLVADLFEQRDDGYPLLNEHDESTITPGLFLCGPAVRHDNHVFCFIYKYRQRFAVVAKAIATSLGLPAKGLDEYRRWGMYLDDLSCCGEECVC